MSTHSVTRVAALAAAFTFLAVAATATPAAAAPPWEKAGIDWAKPPPIGPEPTFAPPKPKRLRLKNGMAVLVIENHRLPLVSMALVVKDAGSAQDPAGKSGLAAFTAEMLDEGAGDLSALALAEQVDQLGATLAIFTGHDSTRVSVSTLSRTLSPTIDLLAKVVTAPSFDEKEGARVLDDWLTELKLRPDSPRLIAALVLRGVIYGVQAAYGRPGDGYLPEFATVTLADAKRFYAQRWSPRAMTLVVVGDVDTKDLAARLDAAFGAWKPAGNKATPVKSPAAKPAARLWLVDRPGAEQADVRIGIHGISLKDKRIAAADVMANILGGTFTSRLNRRLREELGWTYGARSSLQGAAGVGPFVIGTALVTPHAVEGVAEILRIAGELVSADVPAAELAKRRSNLMRELPQRFATNAETAGAFATLVEVGLPDDYYAGYVARLKKVSAKDVRAVAKALVPTGKLIVVVVGDAAVVRAGLEKLVGPASLMSPELTPVAPAPAR